MKLEEILKEVPKGKIVSIKATGGELVVSIGYPTQIGGSCHFSRCEAGDDIVGTVKHMLDNYDKFYEELQSDRLKEKAQREANKPVNKLVSFFKSTCSKN